MEDASEFRKNSKCIYKCLHSVAENIIIIIQKGVNIMAQISLRVDDEIKHKAEKTLDEIGLSMSTAINIFLKTVVRKTVFLLNLQLTHSIVSII